MAIAQVLFNRFFYVSSMTSFGVNVRVFAVQLPRVWADRIHQDISISALYLSSKLNETPVRLRDLINTYIFLSARIRHLLSLPPDQPLTPEEKVAPWRDEPEPWRIGLGPSSSAKGKGKEEDIWEGFQFKVPGFHDEVFWDCGSSSSCS